MQSEIKLTSEDESNLTLLVIIEACKQKENEVKELPVQYKCLKRALPAMQSKHKM